MDASPSDWKNEEPPRFAPAFPATLRLSREKSCDPWDLGELGPEALGPEALDDMCDSASDGPGELGPEALDDMCDSASDGIRLD